MPDPNKISRMTIPFALEAALEDFVADPGEIIYNQSRKSFMQGDGETEGARELLSDLRTDMLVSGESLLDFRKTIDKARRLGIGTVMLPPTTGGYVFTETVLIDGALDGPLNIILPPKTIIYAPDSLRGAFINIPDCGKFPVSVGGGGYLNADEQSESDEGAGESWAMIMLQNYGTGSHIRNLRAKAGDDYRDAKGDTFVFDQGFGLIIDNVFVTGFTDFAIYSSGNGAGIDGKGTKVSNSTFEGVYGAGTSKRLGEDNRYVNNTVRNSLHGFATAPAGPLGGGALVAPGKRLSLIGNRYYDVRTPLYFPWADGLMIRGDFVRGYGYDLDGNLAGTAAALHLLGTHGADIDLRILNTGNNVNLHGVLLGSSTINGVTRVSDDNDIRITADGGAGGGRAVYEQAGDHNNVDVSVRGTWALPTFRSGANSRWRVSTDADNSQRIGIGIKDKVVVTPDSVTMLPETGGAAEVQRPGVPAQNFRTFSDGSGHHLRSTSTAANAKPIYYECNADGPVTGGERGHIFKVGDDFVGKIMSDGIYGLDDIRVLPELSASSSFPYDINVYTEADDPTGGGPVASKARMVQSLGTHSKVRYADHIQLISDGSGIAAGPASADFGAGISVFRKDWQTNDDPGEIDGLGIIAINGVGDVAGLLVDVGSRDGFSAVLEGASRAYLPDGSATHKLRVQAGVVDSHTGVQIGFAAVADLGVNDVAYYAASGGGSFDQMLQFVNVGVVTYQVSPSGALYSPWFQTSGVGVGFNGTAPIAKPALTVAASDLATVISLANSIRASLIGYGLNT